MGNTYVGARRFVGLDTTTGPQLILHKPVKQVYGDTTNVLARPACQSRSGSDIGDTEGVPNIWVWWTEKPTPLMNDYRTRPCKKCEAKWPDYFATEVHSYRWKERQ